MEEKTLKAKMNKQITKEDFIKLKNFISKKFLPLYIIANLTYILVGSYFVTAELITINRFSQCQIIFLLMNVSVIIVMLAKGKYKKNKIHYFLLAIFAIAVFSTFFARVPKIALFGFQDRYEGLLAIAYYLSLAFLTTQLEEKEKKAIANSIIIFGLIQSIYAICQVFGVPNIYNPYKGIAQGFITNQNFFGTLALMCFSFSIGGYIDEKNFLRKLFYIISSIIILSALFMCNTASAAVGLIAVLIYIMIYCIKKKKIIQLITTIVIVISTTAVTSNLGKTKVLKDLGKTAQEATEVVKGNTSDELGSSRMYIWKNALKIVPKYLFVGAGVDNFYYAFEGGPLLSKSGSVYFDKAHNEYLNTLITEGIFGLIIYLAFYFVTVKSGIKDSFKNNKICYILPIGRIFSTSIF